MRALISAQVWLTMFSLPVCAPELNAVESLWAHVKCSLANLANAAPDRPVMLVRTRLEWLQYRPDILNGLLTETGASLSLPPPPR
nr:hypothetical protein [Streptomyces sp. 3211]